MNISRQKVGHGITMTISIVSVLLIYMEKLLIFKRSSGLLSFVTVKVEPGEFSIRAAIREIFEETGINSSERDNYPVGHSFSAISLGGDRIHGNTFYVVIPDTYNLEVIRLNHEMEEFFLLKPQEALKALKNNGYPEALRKLQKLLSLKIY